MSDDPTNPSAGTKRRAFRPVEFEKRDRPEQILDFKLSASIMIDNFK